MTTLALIVILAILVQSYHWNFIFQKAAPLTPDVRKGSRDDLPFLSVVVCFHKLGDGIPQVLESLSRQSYRNFELVLVNDGPTSAPSNALVGFLESNDFIHYCIHTKTTPGKKAALWTGIQAAQGDWIVVTDIDCHPTEDWLNTLARHIPVEPGIILGFSPYTYQPGLLNFIIRQETLLTAFQYLGWARAGHAYMGVGRNLISHKSIYEKLTFATHAHIPTGDDDLFVNQAAQLFPVSICNDPLSFVMSSPKASWKEWFYQKSRHKSGGKHYSGISQIRIAVFMLALTIEKIALVWVFFIRFDLFLFFVGLKMLVTMAPLRNLYQRYDQRGHFWRMWIYEWMHVIYLIVVSPYIFFKNKKQWD